MRINDDWMTLRLSLFFQSSTPPSPPLQPKNAFPITLIYATIITTHPGYKYHDQKVLRTPQEFWLSPISKLEPERGGKGRPERVGEELIDWESILKSSPSSWECTVSSDHRKQRGVKSSFPFKNTSNMLLKNVFILQNLFLRENSCVASIKHCTSVASEEMHFCQFA